MVHHERKPRRILATGQYIAKMKASTAFFVEFFAILLTPRIAHATTPSTIRAFAGAALS
jgi:hypothetical protein